METDTRSTDIEQLRYPTGRFIAPPTPLSPAQRHELVDAIAETPRAFRAQVEGLSDAQLDTPYRPGGWTVRQLAHHVPDSHLNAYTRFKLALTEAVPTVKPYDEKEWSELADAREMSVDVSLTLLDALHARWVYLLRAMTPAQFGRELRHPEWSGPGTLDTMLALYAWHGGHHTAHVRALRVRQGW